MPGFPNVRSRRAPITALALALAVLPAGAAHAASPPVITKVSPMKVEIGQTRTIKGRGFRSGAFAGRGVAGREHHPVGVELERQHFVHGQQAAARARCHGRRGHRQGRLVEPVEVARDQAVRREHQYATVGQVHLQHALFGRVALQENVACRVGMQDAGDFPDFDAGIRQARQDCQLGRRHLADGRPTAQAKASAA